MRKCFFGIIVFLNFILFLIGCNINPNEESIILKGIPSSYPEFSFTQSPTSSIFSSLTPSPTANALYETQAAEMQTHWAGIAATVESRNAVCPDGFSLELPESVDRMSNDIWTIFTCSPIDKNTGLQWSTPGALDYGTRYTKIVKNDFSQNWVISHRDFPWSKRGHALLATYRWTKDGKYLYLMPYTYPGGSGHSPVHFFHTEKELYRLNLEAGDFETIVGINPAAFSLSPNNQLLAYSLPVEERVVHLLDMNKNIDTKIVISDEYANVGAFLWSPNSQILIFAGGLGGWEDGKAGISIFKLTIARMHTQVILYNDKRLLIPEIQYFQELSCCWMNAETIFLRSLDYRSDAKSDYLALNIRTGEVMFLPTPTPYPTITPTP